MSFYFLFIYSLGMIFLLFLVLLSAYFYAKEGKINPDFSFSFGKNGMIVNNEIYSLSSYEFPYNYIVFPIFGIIMILFTYYLIKFTQRNQFKEILGLYQINIQKLLIYLGLFLIYTIIVFFLSRYTSILNTEDVFKLPNNPIHIFLLFLGVGVCVPIFEELMFRGVLYFHYFNKFGWFYSVILTSLVFSIFHFNYNFYIIVCIFFFALILGSARKESNSIYVPIILHILNNTMALFINF